MRGLGWILLVLGGVAVAGCGPSAPAPRGERASGPAPEAAAAAAARRTEATRGPVTVRVVVEPEAPTLSDRITVHVTVRAEDGARVERPEARVALAEFVLRDVRHALPEVEDGAVVHRTRFDLEAERSGKHLIRPFRVKFRVAGAPAEDGEDGPGEGGREGDPERTYEVATDPLEIDVSSMLAGARPALDDLRGPRGLVDLPAPPARVPWFWIGAGAGVVVLGGMAVVVLLRRRGPAPERRLTPEEQAYLELQSLVDADLAGQERYAEFYVELTGIVRRYIERTTHVHAPELTTEEFLREAHGRKLFEPARERELAAFLEAADLIKFAAQVPEAAQIEASFNTAKAFVGLARPVPERGAA